jgi:hypothetical protein
VAVTRLEIRCRAPYEDGFAFGETGAYERLDGVVRFAVDPAHPANAAIVDLDKAPRNAAGLVEFEADVCLLQPADPARANRRLLFYVVNRGRMGAAPMSGAVAPPVLTERIDPGNGFLMRHGWTLLMVGWQWDVVRRPGYLGLEAPPALGPDGQPLRGRIVLQFQPNEPHPTQLLAHWPLHPPPGRAEFQHRPYPAADVNDPAAVLTVRDTPAGPRTAIPRDRWRFARLDAAGRPVADDTHVWLDGGFAPGRIYELVYQTRACPVVGTGLLAVRDAVAFWRYAGAAEGNPSAGRLDYAFGFGVSQCGRFLREYLYQGLNLDEAGRVVFDGLIPHVAGALRPALGPARRRPRPPAALRRRRADRPAHRPQRRLAAPAARAGRRAAHLHDQYLVGVLAHRLLADPHRSARRARRRAAGRDAHLPLRRHPARRRRAAADDRDAGRRAHGQPDEHCQLHAAAAGGAG